MLLSICLQSLWQIYFGSERSLLHCFWIYPLVYYYILWWIALRELLWRNVVCLLPRTWFLCSGSGHLISIASLTFPTALCIAPDLCIGACMTYSGRMTVTKIRKMTATLCIILHTASSANFSVWNSSASLFSLCLMLYTLMFDPNQEWHLIITFSQSVLLYKSFIDQVRCVINSWMVFSFCTSLCCNRWMNKE